MTGNSSPATQSSLKERLDNAAEGCLSLGYGRELYDLLKEGEYILDKC